MFKFFTAIGIAVVSVLGLIAVVIAWFFVTTPQPSNIKGCFTTSLFQVHLCPTDPTYVKIDQISAAAKNAILVSEDSAFYDHHGIDWFELQQSAEKNWKKNEFARGGSTITQQLAKNVYLTSEKSILRKLREVVITIQLEKNLSKNEILEKYLNVVEFGPNLYGIGKASKFYFGKTASQLTAAEGAFLAFLLPNPKDYSVSYRNRKLTKFAHSQMRVIVDRLFRFKKIGADEHATAVYQVNHFYGTASEFARDRIDENIEPSGDELESRESHDSEESEVAPDESPSDDESGLEASPPPEELPAD